MMIPVSFYEGIFSNNFSNNIFYNFDSSVFIEFAVMFSNMEQNDSKLLQLQVLDYIKEQSKMVILSKGDFLTNENKKIFYVESLIKEEENNRYYLLCFFETKSYFILNIFYCIDYRLQDWKTIFFKWRKH